MKIIKLGYLRDKKCPICDSVLRYNLKEDVKIKNLQVFNPDGEERIFCYIECPICNAELDVTYEYYQWKKAKVHEVQTN